MLEDPSYSQVVRWGDEGDSFVVLENERFTKAILPKHFKHSNFASFVRQLNKYDFHKVRHNNEDTGQSPYGPGAWEFKHPEFKANNKDSLDNIRRKAPAPRKPNPAGGEEALPTQQMDLVNSQLVATQQQLEQLQARYNEMSIAQSMLVQELIGVQKTVLNHEHVMQNVMNYLHSVDARQRRDSRIGGPFAERSENHPPTANVDQAQQQISPLDDEPASPLQNASKLLSDLNADVQLNYKNLENMTEMHRANGPMSTPPPDSASRNGQRAPPSAGSSTTMSFAKPHIDRDAPLVYPVGQTQGIDPMYSEHINNIPYPMPTKDHEIPEARSVAVEGRKKSTQVDPGWVRSPQILLVEDDPTCRRIGGKFLYSFQCAIDSAFDGLEAVNKMNAGSKYDMVLMDIIMPNLDGVSATHLIRQFDNTPIIAMTSNIRSDDISMYFQHGMNDVLPKPFTKEGLLSMLEKHLSHLKKLTNGLEPMVPHSASSIPQTSAAQSLKDENSPNQSPSAIANWQSPGHFQGISPTAAAPNPYMQQMHPAPGFGMDHGPLQFQQPHTPLGAPRQTSHRRQASDVIGDELNADPKRQRMFTQQNANAMNHMQRARPG
ncbi:MAG: hypothetical protein LQ348_000053 [Seirophora lacunosa]|nr:MAG: hypothetical protein LQ344_000548 [Seirophora lacunosa]KAI4208732.1 MAG: hypothetical protein LQ348_000053 [Seirophora lacunosa]